MSVLLEVCVETPEGIIEAVAGGADRLELCSALDLGGLTPSPGLMLEAAKVPIPVYAMIRPRAGNFVYSADSERAMLGDIDAVRAHGLAGVVIGSNHPDGRLAVALLRRLMAHTEGLGVTLHRAFDLVPDPFEALEQAVDLGVERILTSGLEKTALEGRELLRMLVEHADGRVSIMAGSGIGPASVEQIITDSGVREVHGSCRLVAGEASPRSVSFGFEPRVSFATSRTVVAEVARIIRGIA
ncbi:copper homeostasis protein CutC [Rhizobiales bacterium RZME27]|uniref:PF03932 family protein CutC n=1 Tax=Endobacterium cereale TaxID=2663029 RepID=A0A6A8AE72_9HYPH|nr:copper homeostasis protein CutC [Endobacterium cereale]MEB2847205.1 copper homeostasis protein CutC [Endobacterium cereale]MQY49054.1 copper homeostasis protein CutC [Endobacterium cereale]